MAGSKSQKIGTAGYDPTFAKEVVEKVDSGHELLTCMNCGVCAASCPLAAEMDLPPRQVFQAVRAGAKDVVLNAKSIFLCTSCYSCKVRCPRKIPVIDVMHGLARYSLEQGILTAKQSRNFGKAFWGSIVRVGRIDESITPVKYMLADGFGPGIKMMLEFKNMGISMLKHKRMKLLPLKPIKGIKGLRKMLDKASGMSFKD